MGHWIVAWVLGAGLVAAAVSLRRARAGHRRLHVSLRWGDRVLGEAQLRGAGRLHVGPDHRSDLVVVPGALRGRYPLFHARRGGRYALALPPGLDGDIVLAGEARSLSTLYAADGTARRIPLHDGDHGRIRLGHQTLEFELLRAQPIPAMMRRPRVDEVVVASICVSLILQIALVLWAVAAWDDRPGRVADARDVGAPISAPVRVAPGP